MIIYLVHIIFNLFMDVGTKRNPTLIDIVMENSKTPPNAGAFKAQMYRVRIRSRDYT